MTLGEDHVIMIAMLHSLQRIIWFAHVDEKVPVSFFQDCLDFFRWISAASEAERLRPK